MRADLHMHGPIGFEPYWLRVQGYQEKNLLKLIADACFERDLDICAITSESDQTDEKGIIKRGSIHDRLGYLENNFLSDLNMLSHYTADKFGKNSILIEKLNRKLYLVSGQTPAIIDKGKRLDHLVLGSNRVPNFMDLNDTIKYCNYNELLHGLEHPNLEAHFGVGLKKAGNYVELCDFIEGHNAQLTWPRIFSGLPVIGQYTRSSNEKSKEFARRNSKPYISTSDAHRIQDAGIAAISFDNGLINTSNEGALLASLKSMIKHSKFENIEGYESLLGWFNWTSKFKIGLMTKGYKKT